MISKNKVYTRIVSAARSVEPTVYVTGRREPVPKRFPTVWAVESDTYPDGRYTTLTLDDNQRISLFEIQIFSNKSNGATTQVSGLMSAIEAEMRSMGYVKTTHTPVDNADPTIYREVARFRRIIGEDDTI